MSAVQLNAQTKERSKIKAPNTQLWWQDEDNGQRAREEMLSEVAWVDCPIHTFSVQFFLLGYNTVHPYIS